MDNLSWSMLDKLRLSRFFEDKGIPPSLFLALIAILVIITMLFLLQSPSQDLPYSDPCGDGICDPSLGEDLITCPADCAVEAKGLKTVRVILIGDIPSDVEVRIEDTQREILDSATGTKNIFTFTGIPGDAILASVHNRIQGKSITSDSIRLLDGSTEIELVLPQGFFATSGSVQRGTLRVVVKDKETNSPMSARVSILSPQGNSQILVKSTEVNGAEYFSLEANRNYAISAEAEGYLSFNTLNNPTMLEPGKERQVTVLMEAISSSTPLSESHLSVCLLDEAETPLDGIITISSPSGSELGKKALINGCVDFELNFGDLVEVSASGLPAGCAPVSRTITIPEISGMLLLDTLCGSNALVRVMVLDDSGTPMTGDSSINTFYSDGSKISGSGPLGAMSYSDGDYTEFITLEPGREFYFVISAEGYPAHTTNNYILSPGESRNINISLTPSQVPEYEFSFLGLAYTSPVAAGRDFSASFSRVLYGNLEITDYAVISVEFAGANCSLSQKSALCTAPYEPGSYDLVLMAEYEGLRGVHVAQVDVLPLGSPLLFEIRPHAILSRVPPIELKMDIFFNSSPLLSLDDHNVSIYYEDGGILFRDDLRLTGNNGTYSLTVNSPYPGTHRAQIYLMKADSDGIYEQTFHIVFESEPASQSLTSEIAISPRIMAPSQAFSAYLRLKHNNVQIPDLMNIYSIIDNQRSRMPWDSAMNAYSKTFQAPTREGIYNSMFEISNTPLGELRYYVIDTSKSQSQECRINDCQNRPDVRKCVDKHLTESFYSEADTIRCIESGWLIGNNIDIFHCLGQQGNRGDWDNSCDLGSNDANIMTTFLTKVPDAEERNEYLACGDMNNDDVVDASDLECLTRVRSGAWFGDSLAGLASDGSCRIQMSGGFCYDIKTSSQVKGDLDNDGAITQSDVDILSKIIADINKGVSAPQELLDFTDFNQDGRIDSEDRECLKSFRDMPSINEMVDNINQGLPNYPGFNADCLNVYEISCGTYPGDLNGDGMLTDIDLMILGLIVSDIGGIFTADGQEITFATDRTIPVSRGSTISLPEPLPFGRDWVIELEGYFDMVEGNLFMHDPAVPVWDEGGRLSAVAYTRGRLPGQNLDVSPSIIFKLDGTSFDIVAAYKGVASWYDIMTLRTSPSSSNKLRIEYYRDEKRVRIYWDGRIVGHYEFKEKHENAFNTAVHSLKFEAFSGTFRYYIGDLDIYATPFGSLACADFNQDGVIDETDFFCMAASPSGNRDMNNPFCYSCTQRGLQEGWYYPFEICWDGYDNNCDGTVDISRAGSRTDANTCDWCPNGQPGDRGGTWCWRGPFWDLDRGARPGIEDGNYGACISASWPSVDVHGNSIEPFVTHLVRINDARPPTCTPQMACHFMLCFDNYVICNEGSWRQMGSGSFLGRRASNYGDITSNPETNAQYEAQLGNHRERIFHYAPGAEDAYFNVGYGATGSESTGAPSTAYDEEGRPTLPESGLDNDDYYLSMDGLHYVGSECPESQWVTVDGKTYKTYYGVWGSFFPCEGKCPAGNPGCLAADGWDNNCMGGDAQDYTRSSGSSCPFVYSWDGDEFVLDSEAITQAYMRQMQSSHISRLPNAVPVYSNGRNTYEIMMTEELEETSYIDSVYGLVVMHPDNVEVYPDAVSELHTIRELMPPISCISKGGEDCLHIMASKNDVFWNGLDYASHGNFIDSSGDHFADAASFEESRNYAILEFPKLGDTAKLYIRSTETPLADSFAAWALPKLSSFGFLELDLLATLVHREARMRLHLFSDGAYTELDHLYESGTNAVPAETVRKIDLSGIAGDTFTIMLEGAPGWVMVDAVNVDFSEDTDIRILLAPLAFTGNPTSFDKLQRVDGDYLVLERGDSEIMGFSAPELVAPSTFFIMVNGYYEPDESPNLFGKDIEMTEEMIVKAISEEYSLARIANTAYLS
jgi:hypothetical protein